MLAHSHGRSRKLVQDDAVLTVVMSKGEDAGRTLLDTGGATHAFGIFHGQTLVREVHDIDPLMTDRGANIARDAFLFVGKNPIA